MPRHKQIKKEQINIDEAFNRHQDIAKREQMRRSLFLDNIRDLIKIFDGQEYKVILGNDPPPTWAGYLGQVEVYYTRTQIERWRKIFKVLCEQFKINELDLIEVPESRLGDISSIAINQDDAKELLAQAITCISQDWKDIVANKKGKPSSDECDHKGKE